MAKSKKMDATCTQIAKNVTLYSKFETESLNGCAASWARSAFKYRAGYFIACGFTEESALRDMLKVRAWNVEASKDSSRMLGESLVPTVWHTKEDAEALGLILCDGLNNTKPATLRVPVDKIIFDKIPRLKKDGTQAVDSKGRPLFDYRQRTVKEYENKQITLHACKRQKWALKHIEAAWLDWLKEQKGCADVAKNFAELANENKHAIYQKAVGSGMAAAMREAIEKAEAEEAKK